MDYDQEYFFRIPIRIYNPGMSKKPGQKIKDQKEETPL